MIAYLQAFAAGAGLVEELWTALRPDHKGEQSPWTALRPDHRKGTYGQPYGLTTGGVDGQAAHPRIAFKPSTKGVQEPDICIWERSGHLYFGAT